MIQKAKYGHDDAIEAADFLRRHLRNLPRAAIITGTGLGDVTASAQIDTVIDYERIPNFPLSTVATHHGRFMGGTLSDRSIVVLQGRLHLYEGYSPRAVTFPLRVLQALKIKTIILTYASGGLNPRFAAGDIMMIDDHVNLTGANPLIGSNDNGWGPRFPDMTSAYDTRLKALAREAAQSTKISARSGVYVGLQGPSLETPAEMRYLRTIGADAVGFSTVLETIAAVHAGMHVLGLSTITNMCLPDALISASVEEIIAVAKTAAPQVETIIAGVLAHLDESEFG